jgi:PAS domain-containing protein
LVRNLAREREEQGEMEKHLATRAPPPNSSIDEIGQIEDAPAAAAPDLMVRTREGIITAWSPGMEHRYGFSGDEAIGQLSHRLLRTVYPRGLPEIEAILSARQSWSGGLMHFHALGGPVMTVNHWFLTSDRNDQLSRVTEVHGEIVPSGEGSGHVADLLELLARELSEPMTAIRYYIEGVRLHVQPAWPDVAELRKAATKLTGQAKRASSAIRILRALAIAMRDVS